jgi:hypothetical protein
MSVEQINETDQIYAGDLLFHEDEDSLREFFLVDHALKVKKKFLVKIENFFTKKQYL